MNPSVFFFIRLLFGCHFHMKVCVDSITCNVCWSLGLFKLNTCTNVESGGDTCVHVCLSTEII